MALEDQFAQQLLEYRTPEGGLQVNDSDFIEAWICHEDGATEVTLDGRFAAEHLRAIADYIEEHA